MSQEIISLQNVSRTYDQGRVVALCDVSLNIHQGESIAIVGSSGCGKSTLMNLMCGIDRPSEGSVLFEGKAPKNKAKWAWLRARRIGFVFQAFNLMSILTVRENIEIPMLGVIRGAKQRQKRVNELIERVDLAHRASHYPNQLSGGERQRVAIARSLANRPDLILADEPTGNLDSKTSNNILGLLEEICSNYDVTLVMVTHDQEITKIAKRIVKMKDGQIITD